MTDTVNDGDREWVTGSADRVDAVLRSWADGWEEWETYHTAVDRMRFSAEYFLTTLEERGYVLIDRGRAERLMKAADDWLGEGGLSLEEAGLEPGDLDPLP